MLLLVVACSCRSSVTCGCLEALRAIKKLFLLLVLVGAGTCTSVGLVTAAGLAGEVNHKCRLYGDASEIRSAAVADNVHTSWNTRHAAVSTEVGSLLDCQYSHARALHTSMSHVEAIKCCFLRSNKVKDRWVSTTPAAVLSVDGTKATTPYLQVGIICVATETLKPSRKLV